MARMLQLDIVSNEAEIFSGKVLRIFVSGRMGELEIAPGHAPLLTGLLPGPIKIRVAPEKEEVVYVTGGILEVQPEIATVLADTVVRAKDLNEAKIVEAKQKAEKVLKDKQSSMEYAKALKELLELQGMLRTIQEAKKKGKR
jgi:F-type H+-transporting ATPase subunit epsilon